MYDNVDMVVTREQSPGNEFLKNIPQYLSYVSTQGENQFGRYIVGYLDNLNISISETRVKISNGSLCKYYFGDNFKTLGKEDTKQAIEKLSNNLHLPVQLANITRIDFATNLILQYPEKVYYPYLGEAQYYHRLEQNNGLYYSNLLRQLVFYGKEYEQRVKRRPLPELYKKQKCIKV